MRSRLSELHRCLDYSNLTSSIERVQGVKSKESVLVQFADVLTGIASARLNNRLNDGSAKSSVVQAMEQGLGKTIAPTWRSEHKYNVFKINLDGGW